MVDDYVKNDDKFIIGAIVYLGSSKLKLYNHLIFF
jgi:hypothetical protein